MQPPGNRVRLPFGCPNSLGGCRLVPRGPHIRSCEQQNVLLNARGTLSWLAQSDLPASVDNRGTDARTSPITKFVSPTIEHRVWWSTQKVDRRINLRNVE